MPSGESVRETFPVRGIDRTGLQFGEAAFPKRIRPLWIAVDRLGPDAWAPGRSFAFSITERSPR